MPQVSEVFDYLSQHPTEADILAAVYEVKPKVNLDIARKLLGPNPYEDKKFDESAFYEAASIAPLQGMSGIPDEIKKSMAKAEEIITKMRQIHEANKKLN